MDAQGRAYREKVLEGTADASGLPRDLRESLHALRTKKVDGVQLTNDLYTGVVTTEDGAIIPITPEEWSGHWKSVAKGKAAGDSGVTTDMLRLAPAGLLASYLEIANAALAGGSIPDSWKREVMFPIEKIEGTVKIEKHRPIMLIEACRKACTGILIKRIRKVWDKNQAISPCNSGFARGVSTMEPIMKLRMCIDEAQRRGKPLYLNGEDLSKAFDSPERAIKEIALRRLGVPKSVVKFLADIDEGNEVHIITSYGVTYDTPGLEKGFEAQCGVKQGTPEGPFIWLAVNDIVWTEVSRIADEQYIYEPRRGPPIAVPLLAFVDDGIYLNSSHEGRQRVLDATSRLYSLLGLERNGEKCFATEIDPGKGRDRLHPTEKPYISTWVDRDHTWTTQVRLHDLDGNRVRAGTRVWAVQGAVEKDGTYRA